jgi:prepilin-type processing-associated H-X9-DG protein
MSEYFRVNVSFPDGHIEEIDEIFSTLELAKNYGESILNQVSYTEAYHKGKDDIFGDKINLKPYFEVLKVADNTSKIVFRSK